MIATEVEGSSISKNSAKPGEWFKPFLGYVEAQYEITDADEEWVKIFPWNIDGLGSVDIEAVRRGPTFPGYKVLYFDGEKELIIPWDQRNSYDEIHGMSVQLTRWHPRYLTGPDGRYILAVRFPSGRVVEQLFDQWRDMVTGESLWEVMAVEKQAILSQIELSYRLSETRVAT